MAVDLSVFQFVFDVVDDSRTGEILASDPLTHCSEATDDPIHATV